MMKFLSFPISLRKHFVKWSNRIKWDIYDWFSHTVLYSYYIEQFVDEKKSPFAYGIQICYSNMATTMHKEDCPNLDPEQIMAIDCTYVYWTRSKERLFFSFYPTGCSSRAMPLLAWARKWRFIGHQQFGCPQGAIRFTKAKERRHHSTATVLGKIGDYSTTFEENWRTKNCYDSNFFWQLQAIAIFSIWGMLLLVLLLLQRLMHLKV